MRITSTPGTYFWSNGYAWGSCVVTADQATLQVLKGTLELRSFQLAGQKEKKLKNIKMVEGDIRTIK